jgi:hypothetical protein
MERVLELTEGPLADAGFGVGRDVDRKQRPERRLQPEPAGERLRGVAGMAGRAVGGTSEIRAARHESRIVLQSLGTGARHEAERRQHRRQHRLRLSVQSIQSASHRRPPCFIAVQSLRIFHAKMNVSKAFRRTPDTGVSDRRRRRTVASEVTP